jgi:GT2 family glycosyltransferase
MEPIVSIVIPNYNLTEMLRNCLLSIKDTGGVEREIILVDDGSAPPFRDYLELLSAEELCDKVVYHSENQGFAAACNDGMAIARGKYIVILNNDTWVHAGWLEGLIECAQSDAQIGLAGPKLLFPNGRIHSSGIRFIGWEVSFPIVQRFAGESADLPEANLEADVIAATGACLLIKPEVLDRIGGFDTVFYNGCEDIDFCFRARTAGYRVVYAPRSLVTHYEAWSRFGAGGVMTREKTMRNRDLLWARWGKDSPLYDDPPPRPTCGGDIHRGSLAATEEEATGDKEAS